MTMRILVVLLFLFAGITGVSAQERREGELTAGDLAAALDVHWWIVKIPPDITAKDMIGIEVVGADGKVVEDAGGFSGSSTAYGGEIRVFCYEGTNGKPAEQKMRVVLKTKDGQVAATWLKDYLGWGAMSGPANGTVLKPGDILFKFETPGPRGATFSPGNRMTPGQVGLRVTIYKRP